MSDLCAENRVLRASVGKYFFALVSQYVAMYYSRSEVVYFDTSAEKEKSFKNDCEV